MSHQELDAEIAEQIERAILQVGWLGQRQFMQLLAEERFDLTIPQFYTLLHLASYDGECKMSDLARSTHQSAASLTGVVDRLIDKQLVARDRPVGDRRQVTVAVTERGGQLLHEVRHARREQMRSAFGNISTAETLLLLQLLDNVCSAMARQIEGRAQHS